MAGFSKTSGSEHFWPWLKDWTGTGGGGSATGGGSAAGAAGAAAAAGAIGLFKNWYDKWFPNTEDLETDFELPSDKTNGTEAAIPNTGVIDVPGVMEGDEEKTPAIPNTGVIDVPGVMEGTMEAENQAPTPTQGNVGSYETPSEGEISNGTGSFDVSALIEYLENAQKEQWAREDAYYNDQKEREDTAYQRAVADAEKAGINPNLINLQPASSAATMSNATGRDYSMVNTQFSSQMEMLQTLLSKEFQGEQNTYDRVMGYITSLIQSAGHIAIAAFLKKK